MRKKILIAGSAVIVALALGLIFKIVLSDGLPSSEGKVRVSATFYPMAEFARQVGGDLVEVTTLVSPGIEPHDHDPTPQDMAGVHKSRVFIYNGAGFEPWAEKISDELSSGGVVIVNASDGIELMTRDGGESEDGSGTNSSYDPHVWLDPILASRQVDNIKKGLIEADPQNEAAYEANASAFKDKLADLDNAYRTGLADCGRVDIVTSHQAFKYLAARYDIKVMAISGLSPDEEPSPQRLAEIAQFARRNDVQYIFFETLVSPKLAETIADELGVKTLVFNPLEGLTEQEIAEGMDYLSVQRDNLEKLRTSLDCK